MGETDEITIWLQQLTEQPDAGMEVIWRNYYEKLVTHARRKLGAMPRRNVDEEDIAAEAMNSLYQGIHAGRFPSLNDREDLWKLLLTITARKAGKAIRGNMTQKRGGGQVRGESIFVNVNGEANAGLGNILGSDPTPEFAEEVVVNCEGLLGALDDPTLNRIAVMKLEGFSNEEIAKELDCAVRSVERKLNRIRSIWSSEDDT